MNRDVVRDRHRCLIGGEWGVGAGWGGTFDGKEERGGGGGGGCVSMDRTTRATRVSTRTQERASPQSERSGVQ